MKRPYICPAIHIRRMDSFEALLAASDEMQIYNTTGTGQLSKKFTFSTEDDERHGISWDDDTDQ